MFQHITSHFLPTFIGGRCPILTANVGNDVRHYPDAINEIVQRRGEAQLIETEGYGTLSFTPMECDKVASANLKGYHFVHFIAHDRTVHSQNIDGKLGLRNFGPESDKVFHSLLTGMYLDANANQERTAFIFEDAVIERIINDICFPRIEEFLAAPLSELRGEQRIRIKKITETYPSVAFGNPDELQAKVPSGELKDDAIYSHLARERYRRDERQAEKVRSVLTRLKRGKADLAAFTSAIAEAGRALEEAEQRSLAEYVVRRKVVLEFIEILVQNVREDTHDSSYQREDILHSFICPLKISTIGESGSKVEEATSRDLWIVDERLTFAQYFSSDTDFAKLAKDFESAKRPDVLIFDHVHGLRQTDQTSKVLLIEFKKPGRTNYSDRENPQLQVEGYVRKLQSGRMHDVKGRPIQLDQNTIFYCFIVADIVGKLDDWTFSWQRTADGHSRIYRPNSGFRGSIELVGWDDLLKDANARNQAFFDKAGISGRSFFSSDQ